MVENERDTRAARVIEAGRRMLTAARTAPKGKRRGHNRMLSAHRRGY